MHINGAHSYLPNASYIPPVLIKHQSHFDARSPRSGKKIKARVYIQGYTVCSYLCLNPGSTVWQTYTTTHRANVNIQPAYTLPNSKYGAHSCLPNICRTLYVLRMMAEEVSCWRTQLQPFVPAWVVTYLVASFFSCPRLISCDVSQLWRLGVGENVCEGAKGRDK